MKTVIILMDTLNRHFLHAYGNDWVQTPNIDRFAEKSITFDNHWLGSAPCMPARRDILTGRLNFLERSWGGLEPFDVPLTNALRAGGVRTHMETDHYHYFHPGGENYHSCFDTYFFHRGQEFDALSSTPLDVTPPEHIGQWKELYYRNSCKWENESDYPTPKTYQGAVNWLKQHEDDDNYMLWVEGFDPHEPFDAPKEYRDLYDDDWSGPMYNWPRYALADPQKGETDQALEHLRRQYAATLTMADKWFGKLLDEIESQNGYEDTLIILTTDHGHMLGEHGCTAKNNFHSWNEMAHIPLMVHLPGGKGNGERRSQLTQNIDLLPTVLDYHSLASQPSAQGQSFKAIMEDNAPSHRQAVIYGWYGKTVNVTDGKYTYFRSSANEDNTPLNQYFLMPTTINMRSLPGKQFFQGAELGQFLPYTDYPVLRVPLASAKQWRDNDHWQETMLFDISKDYAQANNLAGTEIENHYADLLKTTMAEMDSPQEQFERLGL